MKSVNFELTTPIEYANGSGTSIECNFVELREPTGKVSSVCCAIEGLIKSSAISMGSMLGDDAIEAAAEASSVINDEIEPDGEAMLALMVSSGVDMTKVVLHFRELFKGVAWMGGEKQMTSARLDDMSHSDFRNMMGVYTANFIMS